MGPKSKEYSNKHIKKNSYSVLVGKPKEVLPTADEKFVKASLWYFDQLLFKTDQESVRKGISSSRKMETNSASDIEEDLNEREQNYSNGELSNVSFFKYNFYFLCHW